MLLCQPGIKQQAGLRFVATERVRAASALWQSRCLMPQIEPIPPLSVDDIVAEMRRTPSAAERVIEMTAALLAA